MLGRIERVGLEAGIGTIADGLGHGTERRWGLGPAHGASERYADQRRFAVVTGKQDGQSEAAFGGQVHLAEAVLEVVLVCLEATELQVGVASVVQDPWQGSTKLHGFGRRVRNVVLLMESHNQLQEWSQSRRSFRSLLPLRYVIQIRLDQVITVLFKQLTASRR